MIALLFECILIAVNFFGRSKTKWGRKPGFHFVLGIVLLAAFFIWHASVIEITRSLSPRPPVEFDQGTVQAGSWDEGIPDAQAIFDVWLPVFDLLIVTQFLLAFGFQVKRWRETRKRNDLFFMIVAGVFAFLLSTLGFLVAIAPRPFGIIS